MCFYRVYIVTETWETELFFCNPPKHLDVVRAVLTSTNANRHATAAALVAKEMEAAFFDVVEQELALKEVEASGVKLVIERLSFYDQED